ncbi:MAG: hypothetical protein J0H64_01295 [Actinobacteria bacterium]|nr:hypothetical protein [Actinomycetota bacterium]
MAGSLVIVLLVRAGWRRVGLSLAGAAAGTGVGLGLTWWFVDVRDVFGVGLSPTTQGWVLAGFAGIGLGIANLFASRWWRKAVAIAAIPVFVVTAAIGVNNDFGAYRSIGEALGVQQVGALQRLMHGEHGEVVHGAVDYARSWRAPEQMPLQGELGETKIPGTISGFRARPAIVWLPPAALTRTPPALPVLIVLSGQPGDPMESFGSGRISEVLDRFAAAHHGLAPIVVAPDQLSSPGRNPMCVDSAAFGNSATYLTRDVPNWIRTHFRVSDDPRMWGMQGFSQGGTCTTQLVTGYPRLFGSGIATVSQLGPVLHDVPSTIARGFGGSTAAYRAAQPAAIMRAHGPYRDTMLVFGTGRLDAKYTGFARTLYGEARAAGIRTKLLEEPTGHDWHTVQSVFRAAFPMMAARMGL